MQKIKLKIKFGSESITIITLRTDAAINAAIERESRKRGTLCDSWSFSTI